MASEPLSTGSQDQMATATRKSDLTQVAEQAGIFVRSYSPGDGVTRYRFLSGQTPEAERDYFGASSKNVLYTALGMKEASAFVVGVVAGKSEAQRS